MTCARSFSLCNTYQAFVTRPQGNWHSLALSSMQPMGIHRDCQSCIPTTRRKPEITVCSGGVPPGLCLSQSWKSTPNLRGLHLDICLKEIFRWQREVCTVPNLDISVSRLRKMTFFLRSLKCHLIRWARWSLENKLLMRTFSSRRKLND
jgi:hypothetical protein